MALLLLWLLLLRPIPFLPDNVASGIMAPKDVGVLIPGTCEHVSLRSKWELKVADGIKATNLLILKQIILWIQCNHKGP